MQTNKQSLRATCTSCIVLQAGCPGHPRSLALSIRAAIAMPVSCWPGRLLQVFQAVHGPRRAWGGGGGSRVQPFSDTTAAGCQGSDPAESQRPAFAILESSVLFGAGACRIVRGSCPRADDLGRSYLLLWSQGGFGFRLHRCRRVCSGINPKP